MALKGMVTMNLKRLFFVFTLSTLTINSFAADAKFVPYGKADKFESEIARFEKRDQKNPPAPNGIVVVGSSSIGMWHSHIKQDLAPLTIIPRGFGGSNMNDLLHYAERVIVPYQPRAVVIYEGDNDIAQRVAPQRVADTFAKLVNTIHQQLPDCRIYVLSVKPSPKRTSHWPNMQRVNQLLEAQSREDPNITYVDVATAMFDELGKPNSALYRKDRVHMSREGYLIWTQVLKPILIEKELEYEPSYQS